MKQRKSTIYLVEGGAIAAAYAALTAIAIVLNLAYGPIQFRFSEALTILPVFTPAAIPGLTIGCFLGNLASPFGMVDVVFGTLASLIAAILSRLLSRFRVKDIPLLSFLPPIFVNAIVVGAEVAYFMPEGFTATGYLISALQIASGQAIMCFALGLPLYMSIKKIGIRKVFKY